VSDFLDDSEVFAGFDEGFYSFVELFAGVGGGDLGSDSGCVVGDDGEEEADGEDSVF